MLLFQVVPAGSLRNDQLAKLTAHLSSSPNVSQHQRNVLKLTGMSPDVEEGCVNALLRSNLLRAGLSLVLDIHSVRVPCRACQGIHEYHLMPLSAKA